MADKQREWGSGSYTTHVYAVEARAAFGTLVLSVDQDRFGYGQNQTANTVLTPHEWTRLHFNKAPIGVPNRLSPLYAEAAAHDFMTYQAAMALACWFQAQHEHAHTRLVQIEFKSSYSTAEIGVGPVMELWEEDRQLLWHLRGQKGGKVRSSLPESAPASDAVARPDGDTTE